jgi:hypothetical protein
MYSQETCPSATITSTGCIGDNVGSNPLCHGGKALNSRSICGHHDVNKMLPSTPNRLFPISFAETAVNGVNVGVYSREGQPHGSTYR